MKALTHNPVLLFGGVAVVAAVLYVSMRGAQQAGNDLVSSVIDTGLDFMEGVAVGTVETIGERVNVPRTNQTQCEMDKAAGRTWDASFSCPAMDFLKYVVN